jgi:hypothetical protein
MRGLNQPTPPSMTKECCSIARALATCALSEFFILAPSCNRAELPIPLASTRMSLVGQKAISSIWR